MATYSFLDVQASIVGPGGSFSIGAGSGSSEEGITLEPSEDLNTMTIGADGKGMHSLHASRGGKVVVRLLKTSPTNALLDQMMELQRTSGALHGQNVISVANFATGDVTTCSQAAFAKQPTVSYKKEADMIEWHFDAISMIMMLGANV